MEISTGMIILWYGAIGDIPSGYVLCDGNNDTPDLRNCFVIGAGDTYAVGANGGAVNHNHPFTGDGHTHTMQAEGNLESGVGYQLETGTENATGTTNNASTLPPYHALAYIMKT